MKLELRFRDKAPIVVDDVEVFRIEDGEAQYRVTKASVGLQVSNELPIHHALIVLPRATNAIHFMSINVNEQLPLRKKR